MNPSKLDTPRNHPMRARHLKRLYMALQSAAGQLAELRRQSRAEPLQSEVLHGRENGGGEGRPKDATNAEGLSEVVHEL